MALTKKDLGPIKDLFDGRFDRIEKMIEESARTVTSDVCEVMREGFTMVGERFDSVERRLDVLERRGHEDEPWR